MTTKQIVTVHQVSARKGNAQSLREPSGETYYFCSDFFFFFFFQNKACRSEENILKETYEFEN